MSRSKQCIEGDGRDARRVLQQSFGQTVSGKTDNAARILLANTNERLEMVLLRVREMPKVCLCTVHTF